MPTKTDPYATPRARAADFLLILFALLAILFAVWTAPRSHATSNDAGASNTSAKAEVPR